MGARNRVGIGLSYRPARLHRLAELIPWNRFLGSINVRLKIRALSAGPAVCPASVSTPPPHVTTKPNLCRYTNIHKAKPNMVRKYQGSLENGGKSTFTKSDSYIPVHQTLSSYVTQLLICSKLSHI
jgi:hypothetical protein